MTSIGSLLRLIRNHRDISQGELADRLGVTQNFLSQLEHGKKNLSMAKLAEIAEHLEISKEIMLIAGCDIPEELSGNDKKLFLDMKKSAMKIILLDR